MGLAWGMLPCYQWVCRNSDAIFRGAEDAMIGVRGGDGLSFLERGFLSSVAVYSWKLKSHDFEKLSCLLTHAFLLYSCINEQVFR